MKNQRDTYRLGLRLVLWGLLITRGVDASAQTYRPAPARLLSRQDMRSLAELIAPHVVTISRQGIARRGVRTLSSLAQQGGGLKLTSRLVVTADQWLMPSHHERGVRLELSCQRPPSADRSRRPIFGEIVERSPEDGWVLIRSTRALHCGADRRASSLIDAPDLSAEEDAKTPEPHLYASQRLYALEVAPLLLSPLTIQGEATGALRFYWLVTGRLRPGIPLFDRHGRWRTISAGINRAALDASLSTSQSLALPFDALQNAIKAARRLRAEP